MLGISWLVENRLASEEGLCWMEWVSELSVLAYCTVRRAVPQVSPVPKDGTRYAEPHPEVRQSESSLLISSENVTFLLRACSSPPTVVVEMSEQRSKYKTTPLRAIPQKQSIVSCWYINFEAGDPLAHLTAVLLPTRIILYFLVTKRPWLIYVVVVIVFFAVFCCFCCCFCWCFGFVVLFFVVAAFVVVLVLLLFCFLLLLLLSLFCCRCFCCCFVVLSLFFVFVFIVVLLLFCYFYCFVVVAFVVFVVVVVVVVVFVTPLHTPSSCILYDLLRPSMQSNQVVFPVPLKSFIGVLISP